MNAMAVLLDNHVRALDPQEAAGQLDQTSREVFSAFIQAERETVTLLQHRVQEHLAVLGEMER
jgi:ABC-type uncharacterized transport system ATPase component